MTLTGTVDLPLGFDFSVFYTGFSGTPYGWMINSGPAGTNGRRQRRRHRRQRPRVRARRPAPDHPEQPGGVRLAAELHQQPEVPRGGARRHARAQLLPQPVAELLQPAGRLDHAAGEGLGHRAHARRLQLPQFPEQQLGVVQGSERVRGGAGIPQRRRLRRPPTTDRSTGSRSRRWWSGRSTASASRAGRCSWARSGGSASSQVRARRSRTTAAMPKTALGSHAASLGLDQAAGPRAPARAAPAAGRRSWWRG